MNKVYSRIIWKNYPNTSTAINETNLNRMDKAIDDLDNRVIEQDSTKANQTTVNNMVKNWTMDETTGVITVEKQDGSKIMFDLNIEKIPVTFELSPSGILTMTTSDGTQFTANIGSMIPVLTFNESDQIAVSVSGSGVNKTYSFSIKDNSITENKLQPNFLADIKVQSANASLSANNAETSATQAQSYAIGGTGTRENEDTDNAMYYYEQAKQTDIGQISSKVDEINSKLSKQLGNHTVKSDVPENAVFTDTVYDYSALLGYDIYNLVFLKDATYPANKTWLSKDFIAPFDGYIFFMVQTDATSGAFTQVFKEDDVLVSNNQKNIADFNTWGEAYRHQIYKGKTYHFGSYNNTATAFNKVMLCIRKKLETPTEYVPYAPSNVALAEENTQQSTEMMDIKMLGWSVPKECPVQNEVNGNQYIQKVGRVDLGNCDYLRYGQKGFVTKIIGIKNVPDRQSLPNIYCNGYRTVTNEADWVDGDISMTPDVTEQVYIMDTAHTDVVAFKSAMKGKYLYYELATYNTMTIDGNEIGETVSDVKKETTVNLLNPTLQTTTLNGVTCTNNGDGTYTLKGTASADTTFVLKNMADIVEENANKTLRFVSKGDTLEKYYTQIYFNNTTPAKDLGSGISFKVPTNVSETNIAVIIKSSAVLSNILIKPMITTNLDATYDDFVSYTGDSGKLNSDVADIKKDINSIIPSDTSSITLTVTNPDIKESVPSITFSREVDSKKGIKTVNLSLTVGAGAGDVTGISGTLTAEELQKLQSMKIPTLFTDGYTIAFFGLSQTSSTAYNFNLMLYTRNPQGEIIVYSNESPVNESISIKSLL